MKAFLRDDIRRLVTMDNDNLILGNMLSKNPSKTVYMVQCDFANEMITYLLNNKYRLVTPNQILNLKPIPYEVVAKIKLDDTEVQDGGCFKSIHICADDDSTLYVKFCSWSDSKNHEDLDKYIGKEVKVTIEILE